jgi:hypothetical protein
MNTPQTTQAVFEHFLRGELTQAEAVDAILTIAKAQKREGGRPTDLAINKPTVMPLSPSDHARVNALMAELDRRFSSE